MIYGVVAAEKGRSQVHELVVGGIDRSYIVYRPMLSDTKDLPLMIVLHGGMGNAEYMEKMTGMNEVEKLIEDIDSKFSIDTRRVYVTGMSNGAMMAYRLACEIPDKIAAIIPVSGTLAVDNCDGAKDVPVLHIHGDQDKNVPIAGGKGKKSVAGVAHRSLPDTTKLIIRSRQCLAPEQRTLNGGIRVSSYRCSNGAPVKLFMIKGGEHVWPGGHGRNNKPADGRYISASKQAWEFAKQFSK
jgi:polyhydroxybutyrate depolymerase